VAANPPANTLFGLELYELVAHPTVGNAFVRKRIIYLTSTESKFVVPHDVFEVGKLYSLRAVCIQGGYPGLPSGDLTQRMLPISKGYFDVGVFEVTP
jgi:hypothetical protein